MGERVSLRAVRRIQGLTQSGLAERVGISRQAVAALEAGTYDPSLSVAMRISKVLGKTLEDLFSPPSFTTVASPSLGTLQVGDSVDLLEAGGAVWAIPRSGSASLGEGFRSGSGEVVAVRADSVLVESSEPTQHGVIVAGCDPVLGALSRSGRTRGVLATWVETTNMGALELAQAGGAQLVGVHVREGEDSRLEEWLTPLGSCVVFELARWQEGLVTARDREAAGLSREKSGLLRVANRPIGSEARRVGEEAIARFGLTREALVGWDSELSGHMAVAATVASGAADFGVAIEPAALDFHLNFMALTQEISYLVVPSAAMDLPGVSEMVRIFLSHDFRTRLVRLPGYVVADDVRREVMAKENL